MDQVDYRKLCLKLFGTDDVNRLSEIARVYKTKNDRNAGRKRKLDSGDICQIEQLLADGMTINDVAAMYGTSRQVISKYINRPPEAGYTLRMTYMYRQYPCTVIDVDFLNRNIQIKNRTPDPLHRAFGVLERPSWEDFEAFLQDRCFPSTRGNAKSLLRALGVDTYDPLQIVEKTHGRMADDDMWLKFQYYEQGGPDHGEN